MTKTKTQQPTFTEKQDAISKHKNKMANKKTARSAGKKEWDALTKEDQKNNMTYDDKLAVAFKRYNDHAKKNHGLIKRMGMNLTLIVERPTDMTTPEVVERITHVIETNHRVPSIGDLMNDFDLGNKIRMLTRHDYSHEETVCNARNRIFLRGRQLETAENIMSEMLELLITLEAKATPGHSCYTIGEQIAKFREDIANLRSMDPKLDETAATDEA